MPVLSCIVQWSALVVVSLIASTVSARHQPLNDLHMT